MFETKFHFPTVTSTNIVVKELLQQDEYDTIVVSASEQTQGRGRGNNPWFSPRSHNLYISFGIKHREATNMDLYLKYQAAGSLAVVSVVEELFPQLETRLKYPNDVFVSSEDVLGKIAGVLVENEFSGSTCTSSVVGIGVNINQNDWPEELETKATSLRLAIGKEVGYQDILKFQVLLIERFTEYLQEPWREVFHVWKSQLKLTSRQVMYKGKQHTVQMLHSDGSVTLIPTTSSDEESNSIRITPSESLTYVP